MPTSPTAVHPPATHPAPTGPRVAIPTPGPLRSSRRDPVVDAVRAGSIAVVVLWHWVFSVTNWTGTKLTMPNPIDDIPFGWALTWLLQVMPLFFVCGGVANLASRRRDATGAMEAGPSFVWRRVRGLFGPTGVFLATWVLIDVVVRAVAPGIGSVVTWGMIVFVPLWFLGVYVGVIALAPLTMRLHDRAPVATLAALAGVIGIGELLRFGIGIEAVALATAAVVWVYCHQLGYLWSSGWVATHRLALTATGFAALVGLATVGPYPASVVATEGAGFSNLLPTTVMVAALATFQTGLLALARPALDRWLARPRVAGVVDTANALAMPVFLWHTTALVAVIGLFTLAGGTLGGQPTASWWSTRPLWFIGPSVVLAGLLAVLARVSGSRR